MAKQVKQKPDRASKEAITQANKERRILKNNGPDALAKYKASRLRQKVHGQ